MSSQIFPKSHRLLTASDYRSVFSEAPYRASHALLLILARDNRRSHSRLGVVIAKKNVRLATHRNRIKRILRESFRHNSSNLGNLDLVVLARRGSDRLHPAELRSLVDRQFAKIARKYRARNSAS